MLDEELWGDFNEKNIQNYVNNFIQEEPENMKDPSFKTLIRIFHDDKNIYIAAKLFDSNPDSINKVLSRKDDWERAFSDQSDWFSIEFDSKHDHQSGYVFSVNASGVQLDEYVFDDSAFDGDWNAIWQAEVSIDDLGWIVEIEIPFSNLPFYESDEMEWGLNLTRFIQRKHELSRWVVFPLETEGVVSKFGHLVGLKDIFPPSKYEFKPFFKSSSCLGIAKKPSLHPPAPHHLLKPELTIVPSG